MLIRRTPRKRSLLAGIVVGAPKPYKGASATHSPSVKLKLPTALFHPRLEATAARKLRQNFAAKVC